MKSNNIALIFLTFYLIIFISACKKSKTDSSNNPPSKINDNVLFVGMNKTEAMLVLEKYFDNVYTHRSMIEVNSNGDMSTTTDATGLTWVHKSKKFSLDLHWTGEALFYIKLGGADEHTKSLSKRDYFDIEKITFMNMGKNLSFEMPVNE